MRELQTTPGSNEDAGTIWTSLGQGYCAASTGAATQQDPCTCTATFGAGARGNICSPFDLHDGLQWCYVDPSCPGSTISQVYEGASWSFCPPAANAGAVTKVQPAYV